MIYFRKLFDVINYVTFCWRMCSFMRLVTLQFKTRLQKCIRMRIIIFKIFIWGGIWSKFMFRNGVLQLRSRAIVKLISDRKFDDIFPQMKIFNTVIPLNCCSLDFRGFRGKLRSSPAIIFVFLVRFYCCGLSVKTSKGNKQTSVFPGKSKNKSFRSYL